MKIAIVGSRDFPDLQMVEERVRNFGRSFEFVSGGARGVDKTAEKAAKKIGAKITVFPADWKTHGKRAGFLRNQQIVDYCDELVAFWDGESKGTMHSVSLTKAQGKPGAIYNSKSREWELF